MYYREGSNERESEPEISPSPNAPSLVKLVHHATLFRAKVLKKENPDAWINQSFFDDEPRATLWLVSKGGIVLSKEFVETGFSADKPDRDEEYMTAAMRYGHIAIHYPGLIMPKEYVIDRIASLWVKMSNEGIEGVMIQGFLYDEAGHTMLEI